MASATVQTEKQFNLNLSAQEAAWLMEVLQNPLGPEEELFYGRR